MFDYFWNGFKKMLESSAFNFSIYFLGFVLLLVLWRRFSISKESGGDFRAPFHISKGYFFIHNAFVFKKRRIPLSEIKSIDIKFLPSVKLNGARYFLSIEEKSGKALAFFFGKSKENDQLVNNLKNETKKYNIKIRILESKILIFLKLQKAFP